MLHATPTPSPQDETSEQGTEQSASEEIAQRRWLLVIYRVPAEPSSARTAIWRDLRRLGALSLQHAVCLLPLSEPNRAAYARLARRVEEYGGEATVLETRSPDDTWHARIVAR